MDPIERKMTFWNILCKFVHHEFLLLTLGCWGSVGWISVSSEVGRSILNHRICSKTSVHQFLIKSRFCLIAGYIGCGTQGLVHN